MNPPSTRRPGKLLVGGVLLAGLGLVGCPPPAPPGGGETPPAGPRERAPAQTEFLETAILRVADGRVVTSARVKRAPASVEVKSLMGASDAPALVPGAVTTTAVDKRSGLAWEVVAGQASIVEDPFTGETSILPEGAEPVVVRPRVGRLVGEEVTIGISPGILPELEGGIVLAGGGLCADNPNHLMSVFQVDVRAVVNASVLPLSLTERLLVYNPGQGQYYAYSPEIGAMRLRYHPDKQSTTRLWSNQNPQRAGDPFFPARAETRLFLVIDFLDAGMSIFNKTPMVLTSDSVEWPPFDTPQSNSDPIDFFLTDDPDKQIMQIVSQEQYLYPTQELEITASTFAIGADGWLDAEFTIRNKTEQASEVRWFLLGTPGETEMPTEGFRELAAKGTTTVKFRSRVRQSIHTQHVTFSAVSQGGARLSGLKNVEFVYPEASPERKQLLNL